MDDQDETSENQSTTSGEIHMDDFGIITGVTIGPKDAPLMSGRGGRLESENEY